MSRRIYVASSWRNPFQPAVVQTLRAAGHEVYDFRNPKPGNVGFQWSEIDPAWESWTPEQFRAALQHPISLAGFELDYGAMEWADTGVLLLPSGRSAHLEAGYFNGARKPVLGLMMADQEAELMYLMLDAVCLSTDSLVEHLALLEGGPRP